MSVKSTVLYFKSKTRQYCLINDRDKQITRLWAKNVNQRTSLTFGTNDTNFFMENFETKLIILAKVINNAADSEFRQLLESVAFYRFVPRMIMIRTLDCPHVIREMQ